MAGVLRIKSTDGPDLVVWGSTTPTSVLLEQGWVDEVVLAGAFSQPIPITEWG